MKPKKRLSSMQARLSGLTPPILAVHESFGLGEVLAEENGNVTVRFDDGVTRKLRKEYVRCTVNPPDSSTNGDNSSSSIEETYASLASKLAAGIERCPDRTVAERCFRELLIGILAKNERLQARAWHGLEKIAQLACRRLYDPTITTGFQRREFSPLVQDGKEPAVTALAAELLARWFKGEIQIKYNYWGHLVFSRRIDELKKATALKRQEGHPFETETAVAEHTPPIDRNEMHAMYKDHTPLRRRKPRSDKGHRRGPNSKVRSDKGKPRK